MPKTILITGASSGIGEATTNYFLSKGWNVAATMRSPEKYKKNTPSSYTGKVNYYQLDVTKPETIKKCIDDVLDDFMLIDVLMNNAGYGAIGIFEKSSPEEVRKQFEVNVFGLMEVTREVLPHMRSNRNGTIVNISSVAGRITFPIFSLYHGTKWAVEGFTESLQHELRQFNIKMKLIEPGAIKTDFYGRSQELLSNREAPEYDKYQDSVYSKIQKAGEDAPGPEVVAKRIYESATDNSWRLRYPVGSNAPFLLLLRKLLPGGTFNAIVRSILK